jgi:hypothetical protein
MIYATEMADGTLALTEVVPLAVTTDGVRHAVTGTLQVDGKVALKTDDGIVATAATAVRDLDVDSVAGATLEFPTQDEEIAKWHPDRQARVAARHGVIAAATIPADRMFRDAWCHAGGHVDVDMDAARGIHRDRMRQARAPLLAALDIAYQRADEQGDAAAKAAVVAQKQALRDVTDDPTIATAATAGDLAAVWPAILGAATAA